MFRTHPQMLVNTMEMAQVNMTSPMLCCSSLLPTKVMDATTGFGIGGRTSKVSIGQARSGTLQNMQIFCISRKALSPRTMVRSVILVAQSVQSQINGRQFSGSSTVMSSSVGMRPSVSSCQSLISKSWLCSLSCARCILNFIRESGFQLVNAI